MRKPKAFHSTSCVLEQSPFMYKDRFHRRDIIMNNDIMREVLFISQCNHMFSQSLFRFNAFIRFIVKYKSFQLILQINDEFFEQLAHIKTHIVVHNC